MNISAFVLKYRVPIFDATHSRIEAPLQDAKRAVGVVRSGGFAHRKSFYTTLMTDCVRIRCRRFHDYTLAKHFFLHGSGKL